MNIMKNFLTQCTKIIAVTLIIGWGVSAVDAWTAPIAPPPGGTVKAPEQTSGTAYKDNAGPVHAAINVSSFDQIKKGMLSIFKSEGNLVSPLGFFKNIVLPNASTSVYVGGTALNNPGFTGVPTDTDLNIPLTINTVGRNSNNALRVLVDPSSVSCPAATPAIINTDATAFRFTNNSNTNTLVDIFAKGIRLTGGNPAKGKILISVDNKGKAVWATPTLASNGKDIIFDTTVSAVGMCQPPIGNQGIFEWRMSDWGQCVNGKQQQTGVCWDVTNNTQATDSSFCSGTAPTMERGCQQESQCTYSSVPKSESCVYGNEVFYRTQNSPNDTGEYDAGFTTVRACLEKKNTGNSCKLREYTDLTDFPKTASAGYSFTNNCSQVNPSNSEQYTIYSVRRSSCAEDVDQASGNVIKGCFVADTLVTLANGNKKPIQDIKIGDKLKSVSGVNTVMELLRPKLGNQPVYSINGDRGFFTANHPFLTTQGWKSIDPKTTRLEIPELEVSELKIGDILVTDTGNIVVRSLAPTVVSKDTQLYNFELDGDHTYYADGFAVHNKEAFPNCNLSDPAAASACNASLACTKNSQCTDKIGGYCNQTLGRCVNAATSPACTTDSDCTGGNACYTFKHQNGAPIGKYCANPVIDSAITLN